MDAVVVARTPPDNGCLHRTRTGRLAALPRAGLLYFGGPATPTPVRPRPGDPVRRTMPRPTGPPPAPTGESQPGPPRSALLMIEETGPDSVAAPGSSFRFRRQPWNEG